MDFLLERIMPIIRFLKKHLNPIEVPLNSNLREALLNHHIPVASSCGGDAVCSKCWVQIIEGAQHLSPPPPEELQLQENRSSIKSVPTNPVERLSCTTHIQGDILINTNYW